jgi:hypothetical protein
LTFITGGSQTSTLVNAAGCDSLATFNLTVKATTTSTTDISICPSSLPYSWNGLTFTTGGSQTATLVNAAGCDSLATLNLTLSTQTTSNTSLSVCDSEIPYSWNGLTFTTGGSQTATLVNAAGCDSLATLNLTINITPITPTISSPTTNVAIPATGVAYSCSTVAGATTYTWTYTGTGVTIATGQGTENITADFAASATNGDMQVVASNGTCVSLPASASIVLPVTLSNFTATKVNKTAVLQWATASEINSKNFEVQRSIDGRNYVSIGSVVAKGFASDYNYVDIKLPIPTTEILTIYYRLKQVDKDGRFEYSVVRMVNFKPETNGFIVNVYPNPVSNILNVRITNADAKQIRVFDMNGKTIYITTTISTTGTTAIPLSNLSKATYFVEIITTDGRREVEKFVKD